MKRRITKKHDQRYLRSRYPIPADLELTSEERAQLRDPNWITEEEEDAIQYERTKNEPDVPWDEVLRQAGLKEVFFHGKNRIVKGGKSRVSG